MRIFFSSSSERLAATAWDVLDSLDERVRTSALSYHLQSSQFLAKSSVLMASFIFLASLWSYPNKEPKLGRSCREELGTVVGVGTGVCCRCVMRGMLGGGSVIADERAIASEHDCLEPELQQFNYQNSSDDLMNTPSKEDLDNLFGLMFEDYFEQKSSDTTINFAAQPTHNQEDSPSTSSINFN
ncbi:hypothetical protein Tco_1110420 [Tanacetum coccineum]|uniref:Uncharacterized protein n=1 Tax=Tanacetum coccineum TaxID=301880 RepID=A0ABQ5IIR0_9ASTR